MNENFDSNLEIKQGQSNPIIKDSEDPEEEGDSNSGNSLEIIIDKTNNKNKKVKISEPINSPNNNNSLNQKKKYRK